MSFNIADGPNGAHDMVFGDLGDISMCLLTIEQLATQVMEECQGAYAWQQVSKAWSIEKLARAARLDLERQIASDDDEGRA